MRLSSAARSRRPVLPDGDSREQTGVPCCRITHVRGSAEGRRKWRKKHIILVFASSSNGYKPTSATIIGSGVRYIEIVLCRMRAEAPR